MSRPCRRISTILLSRFITKACGIKLQGKVEADAKTAGVNFEGGN